MLPAHIDQNLKYRRFLSSKHVPSQFDSAGNKVCRWCLGSLPPRKRSWCSQECIDEFMIRAGWMERPVYRRDKGICALCGERGSEIDHIIPVVEGGGCCGLENLRTLCNSCHRAETNKLLKRVGARRKEIRAKIKELKILCFIELGWT